jgi:hypothetical protein
MDNNFKVGVYICHCGHNIAGGFATVGDNCIDVGAPPVISAIFS